MPRVDRWYKGAAATTGIRCVRHVEIPESMPVDSGTERFNFHGHELLLSCRRGLWEMVLRETKQSASFWYANSRRELLDLFHVETGEDRLSRILAALGKAA